jgi:DnaK suppressor protein
MKLKAKKSVFDATFLKKQKLLLEAKIEESLRGRGLAKSNLAVTTEVIGDDEPNITHDQALAIHDLDTNQELIYAVRRALDAINRNDGTYGICKECEEPIKQKRLEAVPWAKRCITCEEAAASEEMPHANGQNASYMGIPKRQDGSDSIPRRGRFGQVFWVSLT